VDAGGGRAAPVRPADPVRTTAATLVAEGSPDPVATVARRPGDGFAVPGGRRASWAQVRFARAAAGHVLRAAVDPGDRCAVLVRTTLEHLLVCAAATSAGVALVRLDPHADPADWDRVVGDTAAMLLVYGAGFDGVRLPAMPVVSLDELYGWAAAPPPAAHLIRG
jgi:acyl-CoA synthetase (AMP-forming)/AMP-acid ligase II